MIELEEIGVGWMVYEQAPMESDYVRRGGLVVSVDEQARTIKIVDLPHGRLAFTTLPLDSIDLSVACRPSEVQAGVVEGIIREICMVVGMRERPKKKMGLSGYHCWLVEIAYRLATVIS